MTTSNQPLTQSRAPAPRALHATESDADTSPLGDDWSPSGRYEGFKIAVLVPCYNEEATVGEVVKAFRDELPDAAIYVYDNNSTDATAVVARQAGAIVRTEKRQGKGHVVCTMFRNVDADIYVLVDGDCTYPAESVHDLIGELLREGADMAVGNRLANGSYKNENQRRFHEFGNDLVRNVTNKLFNSKLGDIMSGYRAFNRRFVKTMPSRSGGFEIETEITLHGLDKGLRVSEIPIDYRDRPPGSVSKLNTLRDGARVLWALFALFKNYRPAIFFGSIGGFCVASSLAMGVPVIVEFLETRAITHLPLAVLATGLMTCGGLSFVIALVLDTVAVSARAVCETHIRLLPPLNE